VTEARRGKAGLEPRPQSQWSPLGLFSWVLTYLGISQCCPPPLDPCLVGEYTGSTGLELRAHLVPLHQPFFFFVIGFFKTGSLNYLPLLALNCDPSDLCLLSSWDYRREL
jgi:hypothetical protein